MQRNERAQGNSADDVGKHFFNDAKRLTRYLTEDLLYVRGGSRATVINFGLPIAADEGFFCGTHAIISNNSRNGKSISKGF